MVEALDAANQLALVARLRQGARLVRYAPPELVFSGSRPISADTLSDLAGALKAMTRQVWKITLEDAPGEPTLNEADAAADEARRQAMLKTELVQAAMAAFPDAELVWNSQRSSM